jgi:glycosyltransferase involved in cell wall biosynthesis
MAKISRIKILFLIDSLQPAGTEKQVIALAEGLSRRTFDPVIGVLEGSDYLHTLKLNTPVVNFRRQGPPLLKSIRLIQDLRAHLARERYDIVQTHFIDAAICGAIAVRLTRPKPYLIGTRRNAYHWVRDEPWAFRLYRRTAQWSDRILANSRSASELCVKLEGIAPGHIHVIHNGVDVARFQGVSSETAKASLGLAGRHPLIGVIGNWRPVKGLDVFLRAAAMVHARLPAAHFVLIGNGPLKRDLQALAERLAIGKHVTFVEGLSEMHRIAGALDVAVQCSLSESFSNVLVEYMVAARPIVATRVGEAANMIEDGKEGLLVAPNDHEALSAAILDLCTHPSRASDMAIRASEKAAAHWSWDRIIAAHQAVYCSVLNSAAGHA